MSDLTPAARPALRLVHGALEEPAVEWGWFCGHCAAAVPADEVPAPNARVCRSCGLGLMLETRVDWMPEPRDAFLVVDSSFRVQGLSEQAEKLLRVREDLAVNQPLSELFVSADAEAGERGALSASIADAVADGGEPLHATVRPSNTFGVRIRARIVACGPPRAALIVLEGPGPRQTKLRLV
jgi:hypothetical protein